MTLDIPTSGPISINDLQKISEKEYSPGMAMGTVRNIYVLPDGVEAVDLKNLIPERDQIYSSYRVSECQTEVNDEGRIYGTTSAPMFDIVVGSDRKTNPDDHTVVVCTIREAMKLNVETLNIAENLKGISPYALN